MSIEETIIGFEKSFKEKNYYNKQTQDNNHLNKIIECLNIKDNMKILDLGTGSGYLAFNIAKKYNNVTIIGLDIVKETLERNKEKAKDNNLCNVSFISYDGIELPFDNKTFDMVITRYALHHFPNLDKTFNEIDRVLKNNGLLFISDPKPNDIDINRFVDKYMQKKKDGHIKFYTKEEFISLANKYNFKLIDSFDTEITFPRILESKDQYDDILNSCSKDILESYNVNIKDNEIWITEKVNNLLFEKE